MILATKTLDAIRDGILADGGATFRRWLGRVIPHVGDAYRDEPEDDKRSHLGASGIGKDCGRAIWYGFHWVGKNLPANEAEFEKAARMQRLWNRGHLEEARFIALLLMIGVRVIQQDENGKQLRFFDHNGHYAGSMDGKGVNIPDVPEGEIALLEFKTYNEKRFKDLVSNGVKYSDDTYYVQCQQYMGKHKLRFTLFMAVNKNDEELHAEILEFDPVVYERFRDRAGKLIAAPAPPLKIQNASPGYWKCQWCDFSRVCHLGQVVDKNCRTCAFADPVPKVGEDGKGQWHCRKHKKTIPLELQKTGCDAYAKLPAL